MGSIKNEKEQVIVTFEVDRTLRENLVMFGDGKLHRSTNTTVGDIVGLALWSMLTKNMPTLDVSKLGPIQVSFDEKAGTFVATMKKQP